MRWPGTETGKGQVQEAKNILEKQERKNGKLVFTPGSLWDCEVINKYRPKQLTHKAEEIVSNTFHLPSP